MSVALLTMDDVCALLQVKPKWLYRRVENGDIPSLKLGNHVRFREADIEAWLAGHARKGG